MLVFLQKVEISTHKANSMKEVVKVMHPQAEEARRENLGTDPSLGLFKEYCLLVP